MTDAMTRLGRSEVMVPRMGIGAMTWGAARGLAALLPAKTAYGGPRDRAAEQQAFHASMAAGVTLFDTAEFYSAGASERRLGELAEGTDAIIATKFPPSPLSRPRDLDRALAASMSRLRRQPIDLYQHHFPSRRMPIPELMQGMARAAGDGRVRAVGVSNYSAEQMRLAHRVLADHGIPLASNQVQYSLLHRQPETDGVLDACRELGVTLIAYQPLASGLLTGKYPPGSRPRGLRRFMPLFRGKQLQRAWPVVRLLGEIGAAHDATPAQVALRWLIEDETVLPIPGAKDGRQAQANAGALSLSLDPAEREALSDATTHWRINPH